MCPVAQLYQNGDGACHRHYALIRGARRRAARALNSGGGLCPNNFATIFAIALAVVLGVSQRNPFYLCCGNPNSTATPDHAHFGETYLGKPFRSKKTGQWRRRTYYFRLEWFTQLKYTIVAVLLHVLSPAPSFPQDHVLSFPCWTKRWATQLEADLQLRFMPTCLRRPALHTMAGCRSFTSGPGIAGMIEATPEFFMRYPNVHFQFKLGKAKGIDAYRNGALELVA